MSEELSWTPHIDIMVDKARQISSWVLGASIQIPVLDSYAPTLQIPHKISNRILLPPLESHQDCRYPTNRKYPETVHQTNSGTQRHQRNYWERLKVLNLYFLQRRRERYMIIHVWKILKGLCPNDMNMVSKYDPRLGIKVVLQPSINEPRHCPSPITTTPFP